MKILSWNVNGLRAVIKKGFLEFLKKERPDVLCLQEIKIDEQAIKKEMFDFPGYSEFYNSAERKGYSGTAVLVRTSPTVTLLEQERGAPTSPTGFPFREEICWNGFGKKIFDCEGRVQALEFKRFFLVNAYFPNSNHELSRLGYKIKFNNALLKYLKKLEIKKPVVLCGDYNVAHEEIDLARPKNNIGNPGFTKEERLWMTKFLRAGFKDTFREKYPDKQAFSWWSYRSNARPRDIGWRLDYFCVSGKMMKNIRRAFILKKVLGSDHCPVGIEIAGSC